MPSKKTYTSVLHLINVENYIKDRWHFIHTLYFLTIIRKYIFYIFPLNIVCKKYFTITKFHFDMRIMNYADMMVYMFIWRLRRNSFEDEWFVDSVCADGGEGSLRAVWKCPVVWPGGSTETPRTTIHPEVQGWHQLPTLRTGLEGVQDPTR